MEQERAEQILIRRIERQAPFPFWIDQLLVALGRFHGLICWVLKPVTSSQRARMPWRPCLERGDDTVRIEAVGDLVHVSFDVGAGRRFVVLDVRHRPSRPPGECRYRDGSAHGMPCHAGGPSGVQAHAWRREQPRRRT